MQIGDVFKEMREFVWDSQEDSVFNAFRLGGYFLAASTLVLGIGAAHEYHECSNSAPQASASHCQTVRSQWLFPVSAYGTDLRL